MTLPEHSDACEIDTLISEYLDADPAPARLAQLSKLLEGRADCREQFVAQVQMHGMLCEYFSKANKTQADEPAVVTDANAQALPPRRKRRGRSSAA